MYTTDTFFSELNSHIDEIFANYPKLLDHRAKYPWLTGYLGNPFAGIWFVGENPSLGTVEKAAKASNDLTQETQWNVSRGDKLFREMLVKHGFKQGSPDSPGGWNCYITDVIKNTDYVEKWSKKPQSYRYEVAQIWAPVLAWEFEISKPKLVVAMGKQVSRLLAYLREEGSLPLPEFKTIAHYSGVAFRPKGKLGPMHPQRSAEYDEEFALISKVVHSNTTAAD